VPNVALPPPQPIKNTRVNRNMADRNVFAFTTNLRAQTGLSVNKFVREGGGKWGEAA
jgi:hypothetical protein